MNFDVTKEEETEMARQANAIDAACANEPCEHIPTPEPTFYIIDCHFKAKEVCIGLTLVAAFAIAEFAFQLF